MRKWQAQRKRVSRRTKKREAKNEIDVNSDPLHPGEPAAIRQQVKTLVLHQAVEMVEVTIEHIKAGNYQAMKYLFEIAGLFPAATGEETPEGSSLAKTLLSCLGIEEPDAKTGSRDAQQGVEVDAVK